MSKKGKKIAKAAALLGTAYLATKAPEMMEQSKRARGIDTGGIDDAGYTGEQIFGGKKNMKPFAESGLSARQKNMNKTRKFFGMDEKTYFQGGGMVVTKGQGKVMKSKKTKLFT